MLKNIFKTIAAAALLSASFGGNANAVVVTKYFDVSVINLKFMNNNPNLTNFPVAPNPINVEFSVTFDPTVSMANWQNSGVSLISTNTPLNPNYFFYYTGGMGIDDYTNGSFGPNQLAVNLGIQFSPSNPDLMTAFFEQAYYDDSQGNLYFSINGTVTVNNAVPLPPSLGLFVAALGGLALLAYTRRRTV